MAEQSEEHIYILNVYVLYYGEEGPSRTIAILGESTLYTLARAILQAFHFDFDHLFGFYDNVHDWTDSEEQYNFYYKESRPKGSRSILDIQFIESGSVMHVRVEDVFDEEGKEMLFLYDYGDEWHFIVDFKEKKPPKKEKEYPEVIKRKKRAPKQYDPPPDLEEVLDPHQDKSQKTLDEILGLRHGKSKKPLDDAQKSLDKLL
ncbi:MAG: hypothetical protein AYK19_07315 [Theionarchaea archaeon DG-70-1]|nr:MAG: hypothetical protein AYK19_07315 [Theionarchaea archaeon DG-70-1]